MSPKRSTTEGDLMRARAEALLSRGFTVRQAASDLRVNRRSVQRWLAEGGAGASLTRRDLAPPGRPARLPEEARARLLRMLGKGRQALGLPSGPWTTTDVQRLLSFFLDTKLGEASVRKVLEEIGCKRAGGAADSWERPAQGPRPRG